MAKESKPPPVNGVLRLWLQGIICFVTIATLFVGMGIAYAESQQAVNMADENSAFIMAIRDDIADIRTDSAETRNDISWIKERLQ